jgi:hypothetical protein
MAEKQLRAHALIGPYLFQYGSTTKHDYLWGYSQYALYDNWPLLSPSPYAFRCDDKSDWIEMIESDPFKLRGLCTSKNRNFQWRTSNEVNLNRDELESKNIKMFTKNYITFSKKNLAKFYSLLEPSLLKSIAFDSKFDMKAEMSSSGHTFTQKDTFCNNVYAFCEEFPVGKSRSECKCNERTRTCGCPEVRQVGSCEVVKKDIYKSVQISKKPPKSKLVYQKTVEYDYCGKNVRELKKSGCKKGRKCPAPDAKDAFDSTPCGQAPCNVERCAICWSFKGVQCSRKHSAVGSGTIKFDTDQIYNRYDNDIKQLISATNSYFRRDVLRVFEFDGSKWGKTQGEDEDRLFESWTINSENLTERSPARRPENEAFLYGKQWKFNKIFRRNPKYLYGNIHDPLTMPVGGYGGPFVRTANIVTVGGYTSLSSVGVNLFGPRIFDQDGIFSVDKLNRLEKKYQELRESLAKKCIDDKPYYNAKNIDINSFELTSHEYKWSFENTEFRIPAYRFSFLRGDHFYLKKDEKYVIFYHLEVSTSLPFTTYYQGSKKFSYGAGNCVRQVPELIPGGEGAIRWVVSPGARSTKKPDPDCRQQVGCYFGQTAYEDKNSVWHRINYYIAKNMQKKNPSKQYVNDNHINVEDMFNSAIKTYKYFRRTGPDSDAKPSTKERFKTKQISVPLKTDMGGGFSLQFFTPTFSDTNIAKVKDGVVTSNGYIGYGPYNGRYIDDQSIKDNQTEAKKNGDFAPPPFDCKNVGGGDFKGNFDIVNITLRTFSPKDFSKNIKWNKSPPK